MNAKPRHEDSVMEDEQLKQCQWLVKISEVFEEKLPSHSSPFSPKKFTIPQLASITWLRWSTDRDFRRAHVLHAVSANQPRHVLDAMEYVLFPPAIQLLPRMGHRRLVNFLRDREDLQQVLALAEVPKYSTLAKFEERWHR